jgi:D-3-phosphoglycerate dehydrogenase
MKASAWQILGNEIEVVSFNKPFASTEETVKALRDFDAVALMRERTPMPRAVLEKLPRLEMIVFSGLMNETLDHQAAADRNIVVFKSMPGFRESSTPQQGGGSPSEQALALMLACAKHIPAADSLVRRGEWAFQANVPLRGKTLGIVGYGSVGKPVARYGQALGMRVLGFSRSLTDDVAKAEGVVRADLETLLRTADVISIHLPLTTQTKGLIGAKQISWMKPDAILINTARAHIIDEQPLIEALRARKIAMAGFDVFWEEPLPRDHPLLRLPNVVMTPHVGYVTEAGMVARYEAMAGVLAAYRRGEVKDRYTPTDAAADERTGSI